MRTRRSAILRLMAWLVAVCLLLTSVPSQILALAPKSRFQERDAASGQQNALQKSRQQIVVMMKAWESNGKSLHPKLVQMEDPMLYNTAVSLFREEGGWKGALRAAGKTEEEITLICKSLTRSKPIILKMILARDKEGKSLDAESVSKEAPNLLASAIYCFHSEGGWQSALSVAGKTENEVRLILDWSRSKIVQAILKRIENRQSLRDDVVARENNDLLLASAIFFKPSGWEGALQASGIKDSESFISDKVRQAVIEKSRQQVVDKIKEWDARGVPLNPEIAQMEDISFYHTACGLFQEQGGWVAVLRAAGKTEKEIRLILQPVALDLDKRVKPLIKKPKKAKKAEKAPKAETKPFTFKDVVGEGHATPISEAYVVRAILDRVKQNKSLLVSIVQKEDVALYIAAWVVYGNWFAALEAAAIPKDQIEALRESLELLPREEVISQIQERIKARKSLVKKVVEKEDNRLVSSAIIHFQTWYLALKEAGVEEKEIERIKHMRKEAAPRLTREQILEGIRDRIRNKKALNAGAVFKDNRRLYYDGLEEFKDEGGWIGATHAAGVPKDKIMGGNLRRARRHWGRETVLHEIRKRDTNKQSLLLQAVRTEDKGLYANASEFFKTEGGWYGALKSAGISEDRIAAIQAGVETFSWPYAGKLKRVEWENHTEDLEAHLVKMGSGGKKVSLKKVLEDPQLRAVGPELTLLMAFDLVNRDAWKSGQFMVDVPELDPKLSLPILWMAYRYVYGIQPSILELAVLYGNEITTEEIRDLVQKLEEQFPKEFRRRPARGRLKRFNDDEIAHYILEAHDFLEKHKAKLEKIVKKFSAGVSAPRALGLSITPPSHGSEENVDTQISAIHSQLQDRRIDNAQASMRIMEEVLPLWAVSDEYVINRQTTIDILSRGPQDEFTQRALEILRGHLKTTDQTKLKEELKLLNREYLLFKLFWISEKLYHKFKDTDAVSRAGMQESLLDMVAEASNHMQGDMLFQRYSRAMHALDDVYWRHLWGENVGVEYIQGAFHVIGLIINKPKSGEDTGKEISTELSAIDSLLKGYPEALSLFGLILLRDKVKERADYTFYGSGTFKIDIAKLNVGQPESLEKTVEQMRRKYPLASAAFLKEISQSPTFIDLIGNSLFDNLNYHGSKEIGNYIREKIAKAFMVPLPFKDEVFKEVNAMNDDVIMALAEEAINTNRFGNKKRLGKDRLTLHGIVAASCDAASDNIGPTDLLQYFGNCGAVPINVKISERYPERLAPARAFFRDGYIVLKALCILQKRAVAEKPTQVLPHVEETPSPVAYVDLIGGVPVTSTVKQYFDPWDIDGMIDYCFLQGLLKMEKPSILLIGGTIPEIELIAKKFPDGQIVSIDIDPENLAKIGEYFKASPEIFSRIKLYRADASNLDKKVFPDGSFDFICAGGLDENAFYNSSDAANILSKIARQEERLLRSEGVLYHVHVLDHGKDFYAEMLSNGQLVPLIPRYYALLQRRDVDKKQASSPLGKGSPANLLGWWYGAKKGEIREKPLTVKELEKLRSFSQSTIRKELAILSKLGLVERYKDKREYRYSLSAIAQRAPPEFIEKIADLKLLKRFEISDEQIEQVRSETEKILISPSNQEHAIADQFQNAIKKSSSMDNEAPRVDTVLVYPGAGKDTVTVLDHLRMDSSITDVFLIDPEYEKQTIRDSIFGNLRSGDGSNANPVKIDGSYNGWYSAYFRHGDMVRRVHVIAGKGEQFIVPREIGNKRVVTMKGWQPYGWSDATAADTIFYYANVWSRMKKGDQLHLCNTGLPMVHVPWDILGFKKVELEPLGFGQAETYEQAGRTWAGWGVSVAFEKTAEVPVQEMATWVGIYTALGDMWRAMNKIRDVVKERRGLAEIKDPKYWREKLSEPLLELKINKGRLDSLLQLVPKEEKRQTLKKVLDVLNGWHDEFADGGLGSGMWQRVDVVRQSLSSVIAMVRKQYLTIEQISVDSEQKKEPILIAEEQEKSADELIGVSEHDRRYISGGKKAAEWRAKKKRHGRPAIWKTKEGAIDIILNAIQKFRPDIVARYKNLSKLSETEKEKLRQDIYNIKAAHFRIWGLVSILNKRNTPYFNGSHIHALFAVFSDLNLNKLGFQLDFSTKQEAIASVWYVFGREIPSLCRRYEKYEKLSETEREILRNQIYEITAAHMRVWGLSQVLGGKGRRYFGKSYKDVLCAFFPKLGLNRFGFEPDWTSSKSAVESIRFILEKEAPHIMAKYKSIGDLNPAQIAKLKQSIYEITEAHFHVWGLGHVARKEGVKYFNGDYVRALAAVFKDPRLGFNVKEMKEFRKSHLEKRYKWEEGYKQALGNIKDAIRANRPDIMERYNRLKSLRPDEKEQLKEDIYHLTGEHLDLWGLRSTMFREIVPYFKGDYALVLISAFADLNLNPLGFKLSWAISIAGCESIFYVLSQKVPDIIERYRRISTLSSSEKEALRNDIYKITSGHFIVWGLSGAMNEKLAPYFKGSYMDALIQTLPKLELNRLGFKLDWVSSKERAIESIHFAISKEAPHIMNAYKRWNQLTVKEQDQLRSEVYEINQGQFLVWGMQGARSPKRCPYFKGSHIEALMVAFPELKLHRLGFKPNWSKKELGTESIRQMLWRRVPDIMRGYKNLNNLNEEEIKALREKVYRIGQKNFVTWGLTSALAKRYAAYFKSSYKDALIISLPDLNLNPLGFELDWSSEERALISMRYVFIREIPDLLKRYDDIDQLTGSDVDTLRSEIYKISAARFEEWGMSAVLNKKQTPYFGGRHVDALLKFFDNPRLGLKREDFGGYYRRIGKRGDVAYAAETVGFSL